MKLSLFHLNNGCVAVIFNPFSDPDLMFFWFEEGDIWTGTLGRGVKDSLTPSFSSGG